MGRSFVALGAVAGLLSVVFGAFGAHALKGRLSPEMLAVFETGVRYQMYHALALLFVGSAVTSRPGASIQAAGIAFVAGIIIFSGSLYILALTDVRWLGAITPLGGLAFILGWVLVLVAVLS